MIKAYFRGIKEILKENIQSSKQSVNIAVAWFTHRELFALILDALDRGIFVSIILNDDIINRNEYGLDFSHFINKGGNICFVNPLKTLMHDKFCIIDNSLTITGSYNWTYSAENKNTENIIITDDRAVANSFLEHFSELWSNLDKLKSYTHKYISEVKDKDFIRSYDILFNEINCMISEHVIDSSAYNIIERTRSNISVTRLAILKKINHNSSPKLKETIGMRCIINGENDKVLHIINGGHKLPFTSEVKTQTASDNQTSIVCEIVYGKVRMQIKISPL